MGPNQKERSLKMTVKRMVQMHFALLLLLLLVCVTVLVLVAMSGTSPR